MEKTNKEKLLDMLNNVTQSVDEVKKFIGDLTLNEVFDLLKEALEGGLSPKQENTTPADDESLQ